MTLHARRVCLAGSAFLASCIGAPTSRFPMFGLLTELESYHTTSGRKIMLAGPDGKRTVSHTYYFSVAAGKPVLYFTFILHFCTV